MWVLSGSALRLLFRPSSTHGQFLRQLQSNANGSGSKLGNGAGRPQRRYRVRPKERAGHQSQSVETIMQSEAAEMRVPQISRSGFQMWKPTLFAFGVSFNFFFFDTSEIECLLFSVQRLLFRRRRHLGIRT